MSLSEVYNKELDIAFQLEDDQIISSEEGFTSEDKWQFSKLSFIIGVLITATLFKVFGG